MANFIKIKSKTCPMCGESAEFTVTEESYQRYLDGDFIQDCFPDMSAGDRERFLTGICDKCWKKIF